MALAIDSLKKLSPHVSMIKNATNIGVVSCGSSLFIIDTGSDADAGKHILRILTEAFPEQKLVAAINTHSHADHIGGNDYFVKHTECEIWASFCESKSIEFPAIQSTLVWGGRPFKDIENKFFQAQRGTHVSRILNPDEVIYIDSNGKIIPAEEKLNAVVSITIKSLPGHYFDQIGILINDIKAEKKTFFLGDALFGTEILKKYWIPFLYDVDQFRNSLLKIENTEADFYIPSHGDIYSKDNIHEISEMNKLTTLETEQLVLKILKTPHTAEEVLKEVADYASIPLAMGQYILIGCTLRSYISCLYNKGKITYFIKDNRMLWQTV